MFVKSLIEYPEYIVIFSFCMIVFSCFSWIYILMSIVINSLILLSLPLGIVLNEKWF